MSSALTAFLHKHHKYYFVVLAAVTCGSAAYIFCFHKVIFTLYALIAFGDHFLTKHTILQTCMVGYSYTALLVASYTVIEKIRTGERPTWPIDLAEDAAPFTTAFLLFDFSLEICERLGGWGSLFDDLKPLVKGGGCWSVSAGCRSYDALGDRSAGHGVVYHVWRSFGRRVSRRLQEWY
ncbi:uncharacterized protein RCC_02116 [Ramularia collo-cygni]|uniref:Uncharacterized protein n=1 Tax=Ramularia collo-cygni TaxID=112498 RepID=A0A2D3V1D5_9PEZI|nr:uncharacterized protein RCC_02116 [Ramularia collo-cygni]CZT16274.1 uncharacterized protein RCC_02116 [Ramularia collo-cygni]